MSRTMCTHDIKTFSTRFSEKTKRNKVKLICGEELGVSVISFVWSGNSFNVCFSEFIDKHLFEGGKTCGLVA